MNEEVWQMALSSAWIFFFFSSFLPIQYGENSGRVSFSKDNGGKRHSENTGQQLQGSIFKDTGPLIHPALLWLCLISEEAGKEV